jgi:hypothetical protein
MPPISNDDQSQALHVLAVVQAAIALDVAVTRNGGPNRARSADFYPELRRLCAETARLSMFQRGAIARGLVPVVDDVRIAEAINDLRKAPVLSAEDARSVALSDADRTDLFSADGLTAKRDA